MIQKNRRTVDTYMKVGAKMRLFKMLGTRTAVEISQVLSATDTQKLMRALDKVDEICSKAEDNMFRDHPDLSDEYLDVFYGSTEMEPRNDVDRKVIAMAREAADGLFKRTRNDRLVMLPKARIGFVEVKAPGKGPRPLQVKRHKQLRDLGFHVFILDGPEQIPGILREVRED